VRYSDAGQHFRYGSIGSEPASGLPLRVWKALPVACASRLAGDGLERFGLLYEPGRELPIGVSQRRVQGVDRVWLNCAACHAGTWRDEDGRRHVVLGMPANNLRLDEFIEFLTECAADERFGREPMLSAIDASGDELGWLSRAFYRYLVIDRVRAALIDVRSRLAFLRTPRLWDAGDPAPRPPPPFGPGRVDTFNPYKAIQFNFPMDRIPNRRLIGVVDLPSIWFQAYREGIPLHWDGNNPSLQERNRSAALGAGVTPATLDRESLRRIELWLGELAPPAYPLPIDAVRAARGAGIYAAECRECHGEHPERRDAWRTSPGVGKVVPLRELGTDPHRVWSFDYSLLASQGMLYAGYGEDGRRATASASSARPTAT
jgi:hypothetical protein